MSRRKNPAAVALAARRRNPGRKALVFPCPWCSAEQHGIAAFRAHIPQCPKGPAAQNELALTSAAG